MQRAQRRTTSGFYAVRSVPPQQGTGCFGSPIHEIYVCGMARHVLAIKSLCNNGTATYPPEVTTQGIAHTVSGVHPEVKLFLRASCWCAVASSSHHHGQGHTKGASQGAIPAAPSRGVVPDELGAGRGSLAPGPAGLGGEAAALRRSRSTARPSRSVLTLALNGYAVTRIAQNCRGVVGG